MFPLCRMETLAMTESPTSPSLTTSPSHRHRDGISGNVLARAQTYQFDVVSRSEYTAPGKNVHASQCLSDDPINPPLHFFFSCYPLIFHSTHPNTSTTPTVGQLHTCGHAYVCSLEYIGHFGNASGIFPQCVWSFLWLFPNYSLSIYFSPFILY